MGIHMLLNICTWSGFNWQPSACGAGIIATRPQVLMLRQSRGARQGRARAAARARRADAIARAIHQPTANMAIDPPTVSPLPKGLLSGPPEIPFGREFDFIFREVTHSQSLPTDKQQKPPVQQHMLCKSGKLHGRLWPILCAPVPLPFEAYGSI